MARRKSILNLRVLCGLLFKSSFLRLRVRLERREVPSISPVPTSFSFLRDLRVLRASPSPSGMLVLGAFALVRNHRRGF
jgi:hypothetical protein